MGNISYACYSYRCKGIKHYRAKIEKVTIETTRNRKEKQVGIAGGMSDFPKQNSTEEK